MDIILLTDVDKVGEKHEIVTVKNGYGRNYLIPQGLALIANKTNRKRLAELKRQDSIREQKMIGTYQDIATKLVGAVLKIGAKAGTSGKIFGSVTNIQLAAALKDQLGVEIERKKIILPEEVKTLGNYVAVLELHPEVRPNVNFEVIEE
ncbi:MAG: 50S ribosomal protein L9 [Bacteroidota bacterium]